MSKLPPVGPDDHIRGPADAKTTIVVYGDFACPHTRASAPVVAELLASHPDDLRLVFRHFPLHHLHPDAQALAEITEAASTRGKFWEAHDFIMKGGITDPDGVLSAMAGVGVDAEDLKDMLGADALEARVDRDREGGEAAGVSSTPTFFFDGKMHDGKYDLHTLRAKLDESR